MAEMLRDQPQGGAIAWNPDERGKLPGVVALQVGASVAQAVRDLHQSGQLHGDLSRDTIAIDPATQTVKLAPPREPRSFGGAFSRPEHCPPELVRPEVLELPADLAAARERLAEAGVALPPERIDVYQLGTLLCQLVTGEPVSAYLRSPRTKAAVPTTIRTLIDRALGYQEATRFITVDEFLSALQQTLRENRADVEVTEPTAERDEESSPTSGRETDQATTSQRDTSPDGAAAQSSRDTNADQRRDVPAVADALPFASLGHFQIVSRIGHGGMGDVYKGYEPALDRTVAIKVLPSDLARQEDFVRRFRAEATAVARITHPNVVQIHFIGEDQGHHFFAMQYVDGESLADLLERRKRLGQDDTLAIVEQTLAGLAAAHKRGIVHRDIKPGNILLDRENRRALLADFGLVKSAEAGSRMTATGVVMGTVDYISPEQGRGLDVDARSDLYAIGVLLYQMLSGHLPFAADSPTAMIFQHVYEEPKRLREVAPEVPDALCQVVHKLLAKKPEQRQQTAEEVLADLRAFRTGQPLPSAVAARAIASAGRQCTTVIAAPTFDDVRPLPADLEQEAPAKWWPRARQRLLDLLRRRAPELAKHLQNTQQQVDGAVFEYEQRQSSLQQLVAEAEEVLQELQRQAASYRAAIAATQRRADESPDEHEAAEALAEKAACQQSADDLAVQITEQERQLETMQLRLAQVNATLHKVRSQRDVLNARLQVARAQITLRTDKPKRRLRSTLIRIAVVVAAGTVIMAAAMFVFMPERWGLNPISDGSPPSPAVAPFDAKQAQAIQAQWSQFLQTPVVQANSIGLQLVLIPPGEFDMGSTPADVAQLQADGKRQSAPEWYFDRLPAESPRHHAKITAPFYLGLYEVTQPEYERVMGNNPSEHKGGAKYPVDNVSWPDAVEFCRKLSELPEEKAAGAVYRLPTEAEWEYASRAGTVTHYSFGDDAAGLARHATFGNNSENRTQPVGRGRPNAWGLFDMHGNVWEWCADWWTADYYANSPSDDPLGPSSGEARVLRGGSWRDAAAGIFRSGYRGSDRPDSHNFCLGFRVVRTLAPGVPASSPAGPAVASTVGSGAAVVPYSAKPRCLAFTPVRTHNLGFGFATGNEDGTITVFGLRNNGEAWLAGNLHGHLQAVNCLAFSPDGNLFATGSADATVRVWETWGDPRRRELRRLPGQNAPVTAVAFSPDGSQLLSAGQDGTLLVSDVLTEAEIRRAKLKLERTWIQTMDWSRDGNRVLIGTRVHGDQSASVWNFNDDLEEIVFETDKQPAQAVAFSSAEDQAYLLRSGSLFVHEVSSGKQLRQLGAKIRAAAFAPAANRALSADDTHVLTLWDLRTGDVVQTFAGHTQPVFQVALSLDGTRAISASRDGTLRLWQLPAAPPPENQVQVFSVGAPVICAAISPDNAFALSNAADDLVMWNLADGTRVRDYGLRTPVTAAAFSNDGQSILYGTGRSDSKLGMLASRDVTNQTRNDDKQFPGHQGQITGVAYSADGHRAVSGSTDGTVRLWNADTRLELAKLDLGTPVHSVALSKAGGDVLIGASDESVRLWHWETTKDVQSLQGHSSAVLAVALSADGKRAASAGADMLIHVWDLQSGQSAATFEGHTGRVTAVAISEHGLTVLSGSEDSTVRLWDVQTAKEVQRFAGHSRAVRAVAMSADGMRAISGSDDGTLRLWKLPVRVQ